MHRTKKLLSFLLIITHCSSSQINAMEVVLGVGQWVVCSGALKYVPLAGMTTYAGYLKIKEKLFNKQLAGVEKKVDGIASDVRLLQDGQAVTLNVLAKQGADLQSIQTDITGLHEKTDGILQLMDENQEAVHKRFDGFKGYFDTCFDDVNKKMDENVINLRERIDSMEESIGDTFNQKYGSLSEIIADNHAKSDKRFDAIENKIDMLDEQMKAYIDSAVTQAVRTINNNNAENSQSILNRVTNNHLLLQSTLLQCGLLRPGANKKPAKEGQQTVGP